MSNVDESLEQLLSKASPRPVPDDVATAVAREAVRTEWQAFDVGLCPPPMKNPFGRYGTLIAFREPLNFLHVAALRPLPAILRQNPDASGACFDRSELQLAVQLA